MGRLTDYFSNGSTAGGSGNFISLQFIGVEQIDAALRQLSNIEREKAVRAGLRSGGAYLISKGRKRLRQKLHTDKRHQYRNDGRRPGNLMTSFTNKVKRSGLGVLVGFRRPQGSHSHLVDLGTGDKRKTNGGFNRGKMPAVKFWSETREQDTSAAMERVVAGVEQAAIKIMR